MNVNSDNKQAARAWIDWFTDNSGYAEANLALSPLKDAPLPDVLAPYREAGVKLLDLDDSKGAEVKSIDNSSEVGIFKPDYRQDLVDLARGARKGSLDDYLAGLGERWAEARDALGS